MKTRIIPLVLFLGFLRVGFLAQGQHEATGMNYQAAGPVVGLTTEGRILMAGTLHVGADVAIARHKEGDPLQKGASLGAFFKAGGFFLAPSVSLGFRTGRNKTRVFARMVLAFGEEGSEGPDGFDATYSGVGFSVGF